MRASRVILGSAAGGAGDGPTQAGGMAGVVRQGRLRLVAVAAALAVCACLLGGLAVGSAQAGATAATSRCRTVAVTARKARQAVTVASCDRLTVSLQFATQETILATWGVSRRPKRSRRTLKFVSQHYGPSDSETATQVFVFHALRAGKTVIVFRQTSAAYPGTTYGKFTLRVKIRSRTTRKTRRAS